MKRNLLAIAIPALLVAGAANASIEIWNKDGNKLSVNGRVYALNYLGDKDNKKDGEGDKTTARLGFSGETQITELLSGYGRAEWETNTGSDSFKETRYAFAGLGFGQYGSFDYGRNDGVLKTITSYTDVLPEFGGDASNNNYYTLSARTKAVATYRNDGFYGLVDGLRFAIQYADNGDNSAISQKPAVNGVKKERESSEAYGAVVDYDILDTGISAGAAYAQSTGTDKDKAWNVGIKYDAYNLYLAAQYINGKHEKYTLNNKDVKIHGYEFVAQYGIDFEVGRLTPSVAYIQHKLKDSVSGFRNNKDVVNYVEVGLQYDFNKNLTALIDYKINLLDKKDIGAANRDGNSFISSKANTKDTVALGLIYQF